jgi:type III pantothenate kinase
MILLFDVGNTNIHVSVFNGTEYAQMYRIRTDRHITVDELYERLKPFLDGLTLDGIAISSVVPSITLTLKSLIKKYFHLSPLIIEPGIKTGLKIKTDHPKEVGADLICAAVAVLELPQPHVIVDLGTAIKYIYVESNTLKGVIITPGVDISIKALVGGTALLPEIEIEVPKHVLGTNTIECMQSGVTYGVAAQIEGLLARIEKEMNTTFQVTMTGGIAPIISPLIKQTHQLEPLLVLKGLHQIYIKNKESL